MLSENELEFIQEIDKRFPEKGILNSFDRYINIVAVNRMDMADEDLKNLPRAGYVFIGGPEEFVQNVWQHSQSMVHMVGLLNGSENAKAIAKYHDHAEAIVKDFQPVDDITREEKGFLEEIAARIVFENFPEAHSACLEFEARKTDDAILVSNIDQLEMICYCLYIEEHHPEMRETLNRFWTYVDKMLDLPLTRKIFSELQAYRDDKNASASIYKDMKIFFDQLRLG